jgi:FixJ family two-component response regulator
MTVADPIVYVVDDDLSMREALSSLIRSIGLRVETFASSEEFFAHARPDASSCLVLDVLLPGASGLDVPAELQATAAPIPIIFITGHGTIPMSVRALKEGALEFLTKPFQEEELIAAIRQALERDQAARLERAELAQLRTQWERLTPRERDVLALVVMGRLNKQIASELGAAEQTIKVHRGRVMRKLQARSVPELVRFMERIAGEPWAHVAPSPERAGVKAPPAENGNLSSPVIRR